MLEPYYEGFTKHYKILRGLTSASITAYIYILKEFDQWLAGNSYDGEIQTLMREHVEQYLEWCFYQGNTNVTRTTKLTALSRFFKYLVYQRILPENFIEEIPRPRVATKFVQRFTKVEILRMFAALDITSEKGLRDVCILICAAFAGLRNNEICRITMNDIADERNQITIHVHGKQHKDRAVWLWAAPSAVLRAYMTTRLNQGARGSDPLFVTYRKGNRAQSKPIMRDTVDNIVKLSAKCAGIRKASTYAHMFRASHMHDLRHIKGFDAPAIAKRVGHSNIATTNRYLPDRERIHRVYNSLHEYWSEFPRLWNKGGASNDNDHNGGSDNAKK